MSKGFFIVKGGLISYRGKDKHVVIPDKVTEICTSSFNNCPEIASVVIPGSVRKIELFIFDNSPKVTVYCSPDSYAWKYFKGRGIPVKNAAKLSHSGLLGKLFGKNRRS